MFSQCSLKRLSAPHQLPTLRIIIDTPTEAVPHPDLVVEVGILFVQFTRVVFRNWIFEKNIDFQKIKNYTKNIFSLKSSNLQSYLLTPSRNKVSSKTTVHFHSVQGVGGQDRQNRSKLGGFLCPYPPERLPDTT